ncbi:MAG: MATE family efflux transporter [Sporolactobacillus sp.]
MARNRSRLILSFALPAMIENLLQTLVGFVDTLFVSRISLSAVTAVGAANMILAVYLAVFMAIGIGTSSLIAKSIGAGDLTRARSAARQSTFIAVFSSLLAGLLALFAGRPLLILLGARGTVFSQALPYFEIIAVPSFIMALMIHLGNVLRASGDTRSPMRISFIINLVHLALDYLLIFGFSIFPGFGVSGAAVATILSRLVGVLLLWHLLRRSVIKFSFSRKTVSDERVMRQMIIRLTLPAAAERLIMRLGQVVYLGMILRMGSEIYAANMIAETIETFAYLPGLGLSVAATILVGKALGAGQNKMAKKDGYQTVRLGVIIMSLSGIALFIGTPLITAWFTGEQPVEQMITLAMRIDAFFMPPLAIGLVLAGALQGAGDTKSPMYSTAIGMWGIRVLFIYLLGIRCHKGIAGIWLAQGIDLSCKAIFLHFRFQALFRRKNGFQLKYGNR